MLTQLYITIVPAYDVIQFDFSSKAFFRLGKLMYALPWPSRSGILEALYKLSDSYSSFKPSTLVEDGIHQSWVFICALMIIIAASHAH